MTARPRRRPMVCLAALATVCFAGATAASAVAQDAGGGVGAADFRDLRIEYERKLDVPAGQEDALWEYLRERYGDPAFDLWGLAIDVSVDFSTEQFQDRYFDTAHLRLLADGNGLRYRVRRITDIGTDTTESRLVQLKLDLDDEEGVARGELKFEVAVAEPGARRSMAHSPIGMVDDGSRGPFRDALARLGVEPEQLFNSLTLHQTRRRAYVSAGGEPVATVTLDDVRSSKWWKDVRFSEVELELNEIRYTAAGPEERRWMERVEARMKQDMMAAFPGLEPDQTPKYNKVFDRFSEQFILFRYALPHDLPLEAVFGVLALAGAVALLTLPLRRGSGRGRRWAR